jgi:hypothetical protein
VISLTVLPPSLERGTLDSNFRRPTFDFDQLRVKFEGQRCCSHYKSGSRKEIDGNSVIGRVTMKRKLPFAEFIHQGQHFFVGKDGRMGTFKQAF